MLLFYTFSVGFKGNNRDDFALKGLKKIVLFPFRSKSFLFVLDIFWLKSDAKYESFQSKFECLHKYIWCVYCSVWPPVKVITSYTCSMEVSYDFILSYIHIHIPPWRWLHTTILWVAYPMKVNELYNVRTLTRAYLPKNGLSLLKAISTYYRTLLSNVKMCLHSSLCQVDKWDEKGRAIDFSDRLLDVPLVYVLLYFEITAPLCNICLTL